MRVGVVGATGQVGAVVRRILVERAFPVDEIRYFASSRSARTMLPWRDVEIEVEDAATADSPKVKLDFDERRAGVKSLMEAGSPGGNLPKKLQTAEAAGVGKEVADIIRLRDRADYRRMLGQATRGVSAGCRRR